MLTMHLTVLCNLQYCIYADCMQQTLKYCRERQDFAQVQFLAFSYCFIRVITSLQK